MKAKEIDKINEANLVLRHFLDLSARLLPFLDELQRKKNPTLEELNNKNKIIDVFENYNFDTKTSEMLLDSDILELIKKSFDHISESSYFLRPSQKNNILNKFLNEYRRLSDNWYHISTN